MRIVVIGGSGLIGSKVVAQLTAQGQDAVAADLHTGVNTVTGEGLGPALQGSQVVVDVSNSPSFEEPAVLDFFTTSTTNLLAAAAAADVGHYVVLSVVGTQRMDESGYMRAKAAQENLIRQSGIAYSIVHATQFFEFVRSIADSATENGVAHVPPALIRPIAADDVATAVCRAAVGEPTNSIVEVAGPEQFPMNELVEKGLRFNQDPREVVADPRARYFGALLQERTLLPGDDAQTFATRFEDWSARKAA